jgi:hypothetical protein
MYSGTYHDCLKVSEGEKSIRVGNDNFLTQGAGTTGNPPGKIMPHYIYTKITRNQS